MINTPEKILSFGRVIREGNYEFIPKKYAIEAVEAARLEVAEFFVNLVGIFGHYDFFTKKLWKKVEGFKDNDEAEILAAFLHYWFHNKFGFNTCPCGCGWFTNISEESYNEYIKHYETLFKEYGKWCVNQR